MTPTPIPTPTRARSGGSPRVRLLAMAALMLVPMAGMTACQQSVDCFEAVEAHFPRSQWDKAKAVVWRESRNIPTAENPRSSAKGCFQLLHSLHSWRYKAVGCEDWRNPDCSALAAKHLHADAGGWSPWRF